MSFPAQVVRFGPFHLDLRAAELQHNGTKTKLPEQPFQILAELVEHPGEVTQSRRGVHESSKRWLAQNPSHSLTTRESDVLTSNPR
jgi:DNA-binding response OmpR family regulator